MQIQKSDFTTQALVAAAAAVTVLTLIGSVFLPAPVAAFLATTTVECVAVFVVAVC